MPYVDSYSESEMPSSSQSRVHSAGVPHSKWSLKQLDDPVPSWYQRQLASSVIGFGEEVHACSVHS